MTESESFGRNQKQLRSLLAGKIKDLRLALEMSPRDLADKAGVRQALVSQIERGEANVTLDSLLKIVIALNVEFSDLFEIGDPQQRRHLRR